MVCIMSAMMMMSSVTGTMITPIGAYAVDYENIGQMTADENGKYNLAEGDTLDINTGTIHENNGIIKDNAEGATVEINNNIIEKNEGTVVTNSENATVGTRNTEGNGTVTNNYGTAEKSAVTNNYGTANDSYVDDNYGIANESVVNNNYSSGKVTGEHSVVGINYGGEVADGVIPETTSGAYAGPNPPSVSPEQKKQPDPEPLPSQESDPEPSENVDSGSNMTANNSVYRQDLGNGEQKTTIKASELQNLVKERGLTSFVFTINGKTYTVKAEDLLAWLARSSSVLLYADGDRLVLDFGGGQVVILESDDVLRSIEKTKESSAVIATVAFQDKSATTIQAVDPTTEQIKSLNSYVENASAASGMAHSYKLYTTITAPTDYKGGVIPVVLPVEGLPDGASNVSAYLLASDGKILTFPCTVKNGYVGFYAPMVGTIAIVELLPADGQTADVKKSDVSQTAQGQTDANTNDNAAINQANAPIAQVQSGTTPQLTEQAQNAAVAPVKDLEAEKEQAEQAKKVALLAQLKEELRQKIELQSADGTSETLKSVQQRLNSAQLNGDATSVVMQDGATYKTLDLAGAATSLVPSQYINGPAKQNVYLTALNSGLTDGVPLDQACEEALDSVEQLNNDLSKDLPQNLTDAEKTAYVEAYVESTRQSIAENKPYSSARAQAKTAATKAVEDMGKIRGDVTGGYSEAGSATGNAVAIAGGAIYESKSPDRNAESNTVNVAIAPVFGTVKGDHSGALGD